MKSVRFLHLIFFHVRVRSSERNFCITPGTSYFRGHPYFMVPPNFVGLGFAGLGGIGFFRWINKGGLGGPTWRPTMGTVIKTLSLDYETAAIADGMENFSAFVREILRRPEMVDALERMAMLEKQIEARGKSLAVYRDALDDIADLIFMGNEGQHRWSTNHQEARKKMVRILNKVGRGWD